MIKPFCFLVPPYEQKEENKGVNYYDFKYEQNDGSRRLH